MSDNAGDTVVRVAGIINESIVDGSGIRLVVFAQGCKRRCPGCHNPETHSFEGGTLMKISEIVEMVKKNPLLDGITLSGGEPFEQAAALAELAKEVKKMGLNVWAYTGYTFEELTAEDEMAESLSPGAARAAEEAGQPDCEPQKRKDWKKLLQYVDVLVDGPYIREQRSLELRFRGSANQRLIDVNRTRQSGEIVLFE